MLYFVNPHLITEAGDPHTGIPIMPVMMAYAYSAAKAKGIEVDAIDCIGEAPLYMRLGSKGFSAQGLHEKIVVNRPHKEPKLVALYCRSIASFISIEILIKKFKEKYPKTKIAIIENTQAVTSHSLSFTKELLFSYGADYVLEGDPDAQIANLYFAALGEIDGRNVPGLWIRAEKNHVPEQNKGVQNLDELVFPDWEAIRYQGYWELRYAHGPAPNPFLAVMTSRGCPFSCAFCSVPSLNNRQWRAHSAKYSVDIMEQHQKLYKVNDFQMEDLNPTSSEKRMLEISQLIKERGLKVNWGIVSGTKIETLSEMVVREMIQSGCHYISFSPESGSAEHLTKRMNKPFNHGHAVKLSKVMHELKTSMQACFVIGYPGESNEDFKATPNQLTGSGPRRGSSRSRPVRRRTR